MSCQKHIQRKRPATCPDCASELKPKEVEVKFTKKPNKETQEAMKEANEIVAQHTSREMLANMEKETDELVIKPERKKRDPKPVEKVESLLTSTPNEVVPFVDELAAFQKKVDKMVEDGIAKLKREVDAISRIIYEYKYIPDAKFSYTMIDKEAKDGWRYIDTYKGKVAECSGFKEDMAIFERVKK